MSEWVKKNGHVKSDKVRPSYTIRRVYLSKYLSSNSHFEIPK